MLLILAVLGSILGGIATPTEAASIGAVGATLLAARRARLAEVLGPVVRKTAQITSMIFVILIGATLFSLVFRGLGGDDMVHRALSDLPGGVAGAILVVMLAMFLLGFVMDAFEIIFVVVPIVAPALLKMPGVDPVWLGIMMALNLQTSYMHPPLGPTLFYLRGVAPPEITTRDIYVGHHPVRADPAVRAGRAVVPAGTCDRIATCALWPRWWMVMRARSSVMTPQQVKRAPVRAISRPVNFRLAGYIPTSFVPTLPRRRGRDKGSGRATRMKASELFDLKGRVALVTGASSGLGRALCPGAGGERRRRRRWWRGAWTGSSALRDRIDGRRRPRDRGRGRRARSRSR